MRVRPFRALDSTTRTVWLCSPFVVAQEPAGAAHQQRHRAHTKPQAQNLLPTTTQL